MELPLFFLMRRAKERAKHMPALNDVAHSPVLTVERMREQGISYSLFYFQAPRGTDAIDAIIERITKRTPMRESDAVKIKKRLAARIYEHGSSYANYTRHHCVRPKCGDGSLISNGAHVPTAWKCIWLEEAPKAVCKWCMRVFFPTFTAQPGKQYHCGSRDCRRIEYLSNRFQSQGGIDLTPKQRQLVRQENWQTQRVANYLMRLSLEHTQARLHPGRALERRIARRFV